MVIRDKTLENLQELVTWNNPKCDAITYCYTKAVVDYILSQNPELNIDLEELKNPRKIGEYR